MEDFNLDEASKDLGRHRTLALEEKNGVKNKIHFKQSDPYGFWTVNFDKGTMPEELTGQYTTYEYAEKSVRAYLNEKGRVVAAPELAEVDILEVLDASAPKVASPKPKLRKAA